MSRCTDMNDCQRISLADGYNPAFSSSISIKAWIYIKCLDIIGWIAITFATYIHVPNMNIRDLTLHMLNTSILTRSCIPGSWS